ncbi:MAG: GIY-YIG nuclease family protein [Candidatus Moranbacteria bacterium]|nr:GIY-YIG nuclease family protein [Candidatus Moranbacteria bacterium]
MYYVYVLKSAKDGDIYVGYTNDLRRRMQEHQSGKSFATSFRLPVRLVYYEAYASENDARTRERRLKHHGRAIRLLKERISGSLL